MPTTEKQQQANRLNALKSTGPVTKPGKLKVSSNAIRHGILSTKLILEGENEEDFRGLVEDLFDSLKPSGVLELVLVEKIAVTIWRQWRSVRAETATIELGINTKNHQIDATDFELGLQLTCRFLRRSSTCRQTEVHRCCTKVMLTTD